MQKYKNNIKLNDIDELKTLKLVLHPDKKYLKESIATDLFGQFANSTCYNDKVLPCVLQFNGNDAADQVMQVYTSYFNGPGAAQQNYAEQPDTDFFLQTYRTHLSTNNTVSHEFLVKAVSDFFDDVLLYY